MAAPAKPPGLQAWKPPIDGIREVLHATFIDHAYPPHVHDVWTLFIVDDGAIRYDLHREHRSALPSMVSILPPHVVHDGRGATADGFRERVLYLEEEVIGSDWIGPAVDRPVVPDPALRDEVSRLHDALRCAEDRLLAEVVLADVTDRIRASFGVPPRPLPSLTADTIAEHLRAHLDAHLFEPVTVAAAAAEIGSGVTQAARAFSTTFGIPPSAYRLGRRLEVARDRIVRGQPLADVAAELGFYDQAHLARHFKRLYGATPGGVRRAGASATKNGRPSSDGGRPGGDRE
jgi:AraC-like DNA-binding protein